MKAKIKLLTIMSLIIMLLISCIPTTYVQAASSKIVTSQKQLEKALSNKNVKVIEIKTSKKITLKIPKGSYNKKITLNSPNASVINNGKFNGIIVNNLSKYTEKTKGNTLNVKDTKLTLNVSSSAELKSVTVSNKKADIKIVADGNVKKLTVNSAKTVDIKGDHSKPINVNSNAKGATIKANSSINVTMNKDGNLVVNVENVKVIAGKDDVITKITNNTEITIVIVDKNNETVGEVKSEETSKITNEVKNDKDNDKDVDKKEDEDKNNDKNDNKDKDDKNEESSGQNTNNSSNNSSNSSNNNSNNNNNTNSNNTPIITPPVKDNFSIVIASSSNNIDGSKVVNYELKNNSTKLTSVPTSYRINNIVSGCSIISESFGCITVSSNSISSAELRIELLDSNNNVVTSNTVKFTSEMSGSDQLFNLSELNNGYQITFSYWNNSNNFFNTFVRHKHYVWLSSIDNSDTRLESTNWQVAVVNNNERQDSESLSWIDLSDTTPVSGISDTTYYSNSYKLTFNTVGTYYLRAKVGEHYVYSVPINVTDMSTNTEFEDVEFDGQTYNVHIFQNTRNNASFYVVDYSPEEIENLFKNVTYIKHKNTENSNRGLTVSYVKSNLSSYCIVYYKYKQEDLYHLDGDIFGRMIYDDNYRPKKVESYENGKLTHETFTYYDDKGRTYAVKYVDYTYREDNSSYTVTSGYHYTYDENGNKTFHGTLPSDFGGADDQPVVTEPTEEKTE